jgi:hypothetical protein
MDFFGSPDAYRPELFRQGTVFVSFYPLYVPCQAQADSDGDLLLREHGTDAIGTVLPQGILDF